MLTPISQFTSFKDTKDASYSADGDVPDHILNFTKPTGNKPVNQEKNTSNFLITFNPNVSYNSTPSKEEKMKLYKKIKTTMNELGQKFRSLEFLKPFPDGKRNSTLSGAVVTKYEFSIEYGQKKGAMHAHGMLSVSKKVHIDSKKVQAWADPQYAEYGPNHKTYFDYQVFFDTKSLVESYIAKSGSPVEKSQ